MHLENMKNNNWEIYKSFDESTDVVNQANQSSRTDIKICRFCYVEGSGEIDWLRPCKCSGSMLWVHKQCFNSWLGKASGRSGIQCQICRFRYRKVLLLKPWKEWCLPDLHLSFIDMLELLFDAFILYRMKFIHAINKPPSIVMFDDLKDHLLKRFIQLVLWVTDDPGSFFVTLLLCMTPFLLLIIILSWKLRKAIKLKKRRERLQKSNLRRRKKE
ncbi:E3 ubiquitin-protein ligase [Dirofilaria immitis]